MLRGGLEEWKDRVLFPKLAADPTPAQSVEFAKMKREQGVSPVDAAMEAAKLRLRPILMTSFAFILGVVPLVRAAGAGAESRKVMGLAVFSGLLVATSLIALPNFFVLNTLFGLRRDFAESLRALAATQAGLAVILASLAPFTTVWYASSADYSAALRFNALMFAVASFGAQILLRGYYQPLIRRNHRHRTMLWFWLVIYQLLCIDVSWIVGIVVMAYQRYCNNCCGFYFW